MNFLYTKYMSIPFHQRLLYIIFFLLGILTISCFYIGFINFKSLDNSLSFFDKEFFFFVIAGIVAQLIDGALGMAYGVSCTSLLLGMNVSPAVASASVHVSEIFTTGISGISHLRFRNVHKKLFPRIVIWGVLGAIVGAWLLSEIINGKIIKPFISFYLLILGLMILMKAFKKVNHPQKVKRVGLLALVGGFFDSIGGGGWGPIVTTRLIYRGVNPRRTIGTVNTAEFFVTFFSSGVFLLFVGIESWKTILGLIAGGVIAAPFSAWIVSKTKYRYVLFIVGLLVIIISTYNISKSLDIIKTIYNSIIHLF